MRRRLGQAKRPVGQHHHAFALVRPLGEAPHGFEGAAAHHDGVDGGEELRIPVVFAAGGKPVQVPVAARDEAVKARTHEDAYRHGYTAGSISMSTLAASTFVPSPTW